MSLYIWTLVPLVVLHIWLWLRHPRTFKFQMLLDVVLLVVMGQALVSGADLNPVRCIENDPPFEHFEWSPRTAYQPTQSDVTLYFHPWWEIAGRQIRQGELPLIAPGFGAGLPLFANGQIAIWAPMMVPVWLHGAERGTTIMAVWKLEVAGLGAFLLMLRAWKLRFTAAAAAGVAWAASPYLVAWLVVPLAWVSALLPWVWWATWWMMRRRAPRWSVIVVGVALGWLMGCGLHPETAVIVCGSALAAAIVMQPRRWWRVAVAGVVAGVVAMALAWPTIGYIQASSRVLLNTGDPSDNDPIDWSTRQDVIRQIVVPASMGHPGRGDWRPAYPHAPGAAGVGGAIIALLAVGGILGDHRRIALAAALATAAGTILLVRVPLLDNILMSIPPIGHMTVPRFGVLIPWGLVVLAALSLEGAIAGRTRAVPVRFAPAVFVVLCALWATPWVLRPIDFALVVLTAAAAVAIGLLRRWRLVPFVVVVELALLAVGINPVADPGDRAPSPEIVRRLQGLASTHDTRITGVRRALHSNLALRYGLRDLRAADPLRPAPYARLMRVLGEPPVIVGGTPKRAPAGLSGAWGVGLALTPPGEVLPGWERIYADADGVIWSNPGLLPEIRLVGQAVAEPEDLGGLREIVESVDFNVQALVRGEAPQLDAVSMSFKVMRRSPASIETAVDCDGACLLVVAQPWAPGWIASVDGAQSTVVLVNIAGMGVVVPPGSHTVELEYRPWRWWGEVP